MGNFGLVVIGEVVVFDLVGFIGDVEFGKFYCVFWVWFSYILFFFWLFLRKYILFYVVYFIERWIFWFCVKLLNCFYYFEFL